VRTLKQTISGCYSVVFQFRDVRTRAIKPTTGSIV